MTQRFWGGVSAGASTAIQSSPRHPASAACRTKPPRLAGMWGYLLAGFWTAAVSRSYLISLPFVLVAVFMGRAINQRMTSRRFLVYVHGGLVAAGVVLLYQAVAR